ncbi:hypothetical protein CcaverHIS002_0111570 [Cutaneotrichosporon cavernicola]|uniref:Uncharacterized protein n=1 Tax=Cutaneotrichosporon cavernicola TaxID=279322 RepID=A0AA48KXM2_9TREE|nr:uncharacterized protein CcaverHIS019_0111470 [Cutaneotrichosporon cavernicola]BEI80628.1 hypothetical protein CcaverHIS002_0111570 [Cutaneotrichosporon cavernicola]BEI88429.1 hypothetical protein CcaverHIS019_0111470 [Cutaneotrichosporon cavernicola]BEI96202.1 hypothetical protein CcaverHIS631_0111510 [Cutaneotrichosporon cavernicola]BEJ03973.1 hypothetical protein CcaverHIS641_0111480 [Cutaneotrichosporon cavernicola]
MSASDSSRPGFSTLAMRRRAANPEPRRGPSSFLPLPPLPPGFVPTFINVQVRVRGRQINPLAVLDPTRGWTQSTPGPATPGQIVYTGHGGWPHSRNFEWDVEGMELDRPHLRRAYAPQYPIPTRYIYQQERDQIMTEAGRILLRSGSVPMSGDEITRVINTVHDLILRANELCDGVSLEAHYSLVVFLQTIHGSLCVMLEQIAQVEVDPTRMAPPVTAAPAPLSE